MEKKQQQRKFVQIQKCHNNVCNKSSKRITMAIIPSTEVLKNWAFGSFMILCTGNGLLVTVGVYWQDLKTVFVAFVLFSICIHLSLSVYSCIHTKPLSLHFWSTHIWWMDATKEGCDSTVRESPKLSNMKFISAVIFLFHSIDSILPCLVLPSPPAPHPSTTTTTTLKAFTTTNTTTSKSITTATTSSQATGTLTSFPILTIFQETYSSIEAYWVTS